MSVTATELEAWLISAPPEVPAPVRQVDQQHVRDLDARSNRADDELALFTLSAHGVPERPQAGPIVVEVDGSGLTIVRDVLGAVYGSGGTWAEAQNDFYVALDDHLAFLRENSPGLHPRLLEQLGALQRIFPGR